MDWRRVQKGGERGGRGELEESKEKKREEGRGRGE